MKRLRKLAMAVLILTFLLPTNAFADNIFDTFRIVADELPYSKVVQAYGEDDLVIVSDGANLGVIDLYGKVIVESGTL